MQCARVAIYRVASGDVDEVIQRAQQGMLPTFQKQPGFVGYGLIKTSDNAKIVSISFWQSVEQADAATQVAAQWVRANLANMLQLEQNLTGDTAFFKSLAPIGM